MYVCVYVCMIYTYTRMYIELLHRRSAYVCVCVCVCMIYTYTHMYAEPVHLR